MKKFLFSVVTLSFGMSGCCFCASGKASAPKMVVAPKPAPAPKPAALPAAPAMPSERVTIALDIQFDTDQAVVKPMYDDQLKKVADFLRTYTASSAEIEGHTDNVGEAGYNRALSQRRSEAVRSALIERFGADGARLTAKGYGPDRPVADNGSSEGRAANRRVAATFTAIKS